MTQQNAPAADRAAMIETITARMRGRAENYDVPALVDDLIERGEADLDAIGMATWTAACARHERPEYRALRRF